MLPKNHFIFGMIAFAVLYFGFSVGVFGCFIFLVATVGIDVDHYLYYVYRKKDWNLERAIRWFVNSGKNIAKLDKKKRVEFYTGFCFLHGIEVVVLFWVLGFFTWNSFYFVSLGFGFHLILDYVHQVRTKNRFDKFSIVYDYFKYGDLKFVGELEGLGKRTTEGLKNK